MNRTMNEHPSKNETKHPVRGTRQTLTISNRRPLINPEHQGEHA